MDEGAEVKDVASGLPQTAETGQQTCNVNLIDMLRAAIWMETMQRCQEIARGMVDKAAEGQIQHFKVLVGMAEEHAMLQAAAAKPVGRSIASAWGAEPEWQGGTCATCTLRAVAA